MTWARALAVLAAAFLVGAVALAFLLPPGTPLGTIVARFGRGALFGLHDGVAAVSGEWGWRNLALPLLVRPAWLLPASIAIVLAGLSATVASAKGAPRGQRRRS